MAKLFPNLMNITYASFKTQFGVGSNKNTINNSPVCPSSLGSMKKDSWNKIGTKIFSSKINSIPKVKNLGSDTY